MSEAALPIETTIRWFGPSWGAQICSPLNEVEAPIGSFCRGMCSKAIQPGEPGITLPLLGPLDQPPERVPYHLVCFMAEIIPPDPYADAPSGDLS